MLDAQRKAAWADIARRIAHEIKNPLTPIQLAAERLGAKYKPEGEKEKEAFSTYVDTIIRQVDDIGRLVNEFSSFARMPAPVMAHHDLVEIVSSQIALLKPGHTDVQFTLNDHDMGEVGLICDDGLLRQAITNLLQNAIDALVETNIKNKQINIELLQNDHHITVKISDNGPGLPEDKIDDLTKPYVTLRENGTGLGLAIVNKIIEDHSGELTLGNATDGDNLNGAVVQLIFQRPSS